MEPNDVNETTASNQPHEPGDANVDAGAPPSASASGASDGPPLAGVIENVAFLDLTAITSREELDRIASLRNIAVILVNESLSGHLARIPTKNVASIVPIPDGARPVVHTGSLVMGGDGLADPSTADAVLIVTGTLALTTPVREVSYRSIIVTGLVLAPEGSEAALGAGLTRVTGSVQYYRHAEGQRIRTLSGQVTLGADVLANVGGTPDDVLVVTGQLVVDEPVDTVGFQRIIGAGQLLLPRASQALLAPVLSADGQVVWYGGDPVRVFIGEERFDRAFFELIEEPLGLVLIGAITLADDVPAELLREKISEIALVGELTASPAVVPALQLITTAKHGTITRTRDDGAQR